MLERVQSAVASLESGTRSLIHDVMDDTKSNWNTALNSNASAGERTIAGLGLAKDGLEIVLGGAVAGAAAVGLFYGMERFGAVARLAKLGTGTDSFATAREAGNAIRTIRATEAGNAIRAMRAPDSGNAIRNLFQFSARDARFANVPVGTAEHGLLMGQILRAMNPEEARAIHEISQATRNSF
jgi:hypothetical protein